MFLDFSVFQAFLWFASWCCSRSTSPGLRSASPGWAWCTSWPACRPSWAPWSTTCSWTMRAGSPSTTPCWSWTSVGSAWSTRWVGLLQLSFCYCCRVCFQALMLPYWPLMTLLGGVASAHFTTVGGACRSKQPTSQVITDYSMLSLSSRCDKTDCSFIINRFFLMHVYTQ